MKITKLEHACLDITNGPSRLVIDPGAFAGSLTNLEGITALVITHVHQDHFDVDKVTQLLTASPEVQVFTTQQVAEKLQGAKVTVPQLDKQYSVGNFTLEFFGGAHDFIFDGLQTPQDQNYGVLVNDRLYYPGDSFAACPKPHTVLAVPGNAPWMKVEEARVFMEADPSQMVFPTHNGFVNEAGQGLIDRLLGGRAQETGRAYHSLKPGESIEV
ncbi:MAG TPA: MBL fold metallo-hydrolase [Candidatus Microsaccharimonas sp.]|nr:MBL fold metallo-hydrolase [Candidatus Microsaccharimonas sp.]